jgi:lipoyl(octanoyl) transferase
MNRERWLLLRSGPGHFDFNMAMDEALLEAMPRLGHPVVRFYGWLEPAASFGYFQRYGELEQLTRLRPLVRRPTAGGLVPHEADWTYSMAFPPGHWWYSLSAVESYRRVHAWLLHSFAELGVPTQLAASARKSLQCFEGHEHFDLLWGGKKIAGAAQRRRRDGLLIQGSVQPPPLSLAREKWQETMCAVAAARPGVDWLESSPDSEVLSRARELAQSKYGRADYNRRR